MKHAFVFPLSSVHPMLIVRLTCCLVLLCSTTSCGLLVDKVLEGGDYGEICEVQSDCKDEFVCVRAAPIDPGQQASLGYRCLQPCQNSSSCTESEYHKSCCRMGFENQALTACFEETSEFCAQVVSFD